MGKILGIGLIMALVGVVLWFTRKGGEDTAGALETPLATVTVDGESYTFTEPGIYEIPVQMPLLDEEPWIPPEPEIGTPEAPLTAEIPEPLISFTGPGSWYEIRKIEETLGLTEDEYAREMAEIRVTPASELTAEQVYAKGGQTTLEAAQDVVDFKERVKLYGGGYVAGILVTPETWQGSVTEFAQYVRASLDR